MKKRFLRILCLILIVCTAGTLLAAEACAATTTVTYGNFVFSVGKTSATLTEYKGTAKTVKIPSTIKGVPVTAIGDYSFWQKKSITSLTIPDTVKTIGSAAFNECTGLKKLVLPNDLKTIKSAAFWYCQNLASVVMGPNVSSIGKNAFKGCSSKLTFYVVASTKGETLAKSISGATVGYRYIKSLKTEPDVSVEIGKTAALKVTYTPSKVYNSTITYSSSDKSIATVSSGGVVTGVKCGKAVITCKAADGSGKSVKATVTVTPAQVASVKQSATGADCYTLTWSSAKGASKYRLYSYDSTAKKWVALTTTTAKSYTVKNLALGSSTKYRVRALTTVNKETVYGPYCPSFTASVLKPATVTGVTMSANTANSVTLKWNTAANAVGYKIYKYDRAKDSYSLIATTKSLTYTVKSLAANSEYTYCIKSYLTCSGKTLLSDKYSSKAACCTLPDGVSGLAVISDTVYCDRFSVSWNKKSGIDGYEISYKPLSDTAWKTMKIEKSDQASAELTELKNSALYEVKIRAYANHFSKTYYSSYSSVIKAETSFIPKTSRDAFNALIASADKTKNTASSFTVFISTETSQRSDCTDSPICADILEAAAASCKAQNAKTYKFENGVTGDKTLKVSDIFNIPLSAEQFDAEKTSFKLDGAGYTVTASVSDRLIPEIDWEALCSEYGFTVDSIEYTSQIEKAKIRNELIDNITLSTVFTADITVGEESFTISEKLTYTYIFIRN